MNKQEAIDLLTELKTRKDADIHFIQEKLAKLARRLSELKLDVVDINNDIKTLERMEAETAPDGFLDYHFFGMM